MLVMTESAAEVVKSVVIPQGADGAGLRIMAVSPPDSAAELELAMAAGPREDDEVVETSGARVFVERQAVAYLHDKILDARVDEQGKAQFLLDVQTPGRP
jgi:iron-sulfur cluster assembly protein